MEKIKQFSDDGKPQTTMAANKVNYPHQEASNGALEYTSAQEPKPQGGPFPLKNKKRNHRFPLEEVAQNNILNHGLDRSSVNPVE